MIKQGAQTYTSIRQRGGLVQKVSLSLGKRPCLFVFVKGLRAANVAHVLEHVDIRGDHVFVYLLAEVIEIMRSQG